MPCKRRHIIGRPPLGVVAWTTPAKVLFFYTRWYPFRPATWYPIRLALPYTPYGQRTVYTSAGTNDPLATAPTIAEKRIIDSRPILFGTMIAAQLVGLARVVRAECCGQAMGIAWDAGRFVGWFVNDESCAQRLGRSIDLHEASWQRTRRVSQESFFSVAMWVSSSSASAQPMK